MAKTNGPLFRSDARGGVGGIVHNTYRGLHTVKAKTAPHQSSSPKALQQRALAIDMARAWADCQFKSAWDAYAVEHATSGFGGAIRPSGANCFVALNTQINRFGMEVPLERPPTAPRPSPVTGLYLYQDKFGPHAGWILPGGTSEFVEFWYHGPRSAGRKADLNLAQYYSIIYADGHGIYFDGMSPGQFTFYARQCDPKTGLSSEFVSEDIFFTGEG